MTDKSDSGRMLLSHNFTLIESEAHPLNREEFAEIFIKALENRAGIGCSAIENPHWVVEVRYETSRYSPLEAGQRCVDALAEYRLSHKNKGFQIMALGGLKTTPPTGSSSEFQGTDISNREGRRFTDEQRIAQEELLPIGFVGLVSSSMKSSSAVQFSNHR